MILIPYSKVNFETKHSKEETKRLLSAKFGIEMQSDSSNGIKNYFKNMLKGYKGVIGESNFEIIQKKVGQDIFTLSVIGKIKSDNESTKIETKIIFNSSFWTSFIFIAMITGALATGIYLSSRLSGELNPAFWSLLEINLIVYVGSLIFYQIKKYKMNGLLMNLLNAKKV